MSVIGMHAGQTFDLLGDALDAREASLSPTSFSLEKRSESKHVISNWWSKPVIEPRKIKSEASSPQQIPRIVAEVKDEYDDEDSKVANNLSLAKMTERLQKHQLQHAQYKMKQKNVDDMCSVSGEEEDDEVKKEKDVLKKHCKDWNDEALARMKKNEQLVISPSPSSLSSSGSPSCDRILYGQSGAKRKSRGLVFNKARRIPMRKKQKTAQNLKKEKSSKTLKIQKHQKPLLLTNKDNKIRESSSSQDGKEIEKLKISEALEYVLEATNLVDIVATCTNSKKSAFATLRRLQRDISELKYGQRRNSIRANFAIRQMKSMAETHAKGHVEVVQHLKTLRNGQERERSRRPLKASKPPLPKFSRFSKKKSKKTKRKNHKSKNLRIESKGLINLVQVEILESTFQGGSFFSKKNRKGGKSKQTGQIGFGLVGLNAKRARRVRLTNTSEKKVIFSAELLYSRTGTVNDVSNNNGARWKIGVRDENGSKNGFACGGSQLLSKGQILKRTAAATAAIVEAAKSLSLKEKSKKKGQDPCLSIANINGSCAAVFELLPHTSVTLVISFKSPRWLPSDLLVSSTLRNQFQLRRKFLPPLHPKTSSSSDKKKIKKEIADLKAVLILHAEEDKVLQTATFDLLARVGITDNGMNNKKEKQDDKTNFTKIASKYENIVHNLSSKKEEENSNTTPPSTGKIVRNPTIQASSPGERLRALEKKNENTSVVNTIFTSLENYNSSICFFAQENTAKCVRYIPLENNGSEVSIISATIIGGEGGFQLETSKVVIPKHGKDSLPVIWNHRLQSEQRSRRLELLVDSDESSILNQSTAPVEEAILLVRDERLPQMEYRIKLEGFSKSLIEK
eukprot:g5235.t1